MIDYDDQGQVFGIEKADTLLEYIPNKELDALGNLPQRTIERWIKSLRELDKIEFKGAPKTAG